MRQPLHNSIIWQVVHGLLWFRGQSGPLGDAKPSPLDTKCEKPAKAPYEEFYMKIQYVKHLCIPFTVVALLLIYAGTASGDAVPLDPSDLKIFLLEGYQQVFSIIGDVKVKYDLQQWTSPEFAEKFPEMPAGKSPPIVFQYYQKNDQERLDFSTPKSYGGTGLASFTIHDGSFTLHHWPTKGTGDSRTQRGRAYREKSNRGLIEQSEGPIRFFGYEYGILPTDVLLSPDLTLETEATRVGNMMAYKATAKFVTGGQTYICSYWMSPERSCLPVKMELRDTTGLLQKAMTAEKFLQLQDGRWVISQVRFSEYVSQNNRPIEIGQDIYTIKELLLEPRCDEGLFKTDPGILPTGTLFQDLVSGLEYTIGEGPLSDETISKIIDKTIYDFGISPNNIKLGIPSIDDAPARTKDLFSRQGVRTKNQRPPKESSMLQLLSWCLILALVIWVTFLAVVLFYRKKKKLLRTFKKTTLQNSKAEIS